MAKGKEQGAAAGAKLVEKEAVGRGSVGAKVYKAYIAGCVFLVGGILGVCDRV